jgi:putative phosphoesterase
MKIGIISDTHNYFDDRIPHLFQGVEHILHAGDIGQPRILLGLEQIAPVTAVSGNTDDLGFGYHPVETVILGGRKFLIQHIVSPHLLSESLQRRIKSEKPQVIVFGHTHKPFSQELDGILFCNPGYAGKTRFGMERSLAVLHLEAEGWRTEFLPLA